MKGKEVEVSCGNSTGFKGEVVGVDEGVLTLKDRDGKTFFIAIGAIVAVNESNDQHLRPGFLG